MKRFHLRLNRRDFSGAPDGGLGGTRLCEMFAEQKVLRDQPASRAKGETRYPAFHERRREPDGHVRLQAGTGETPRPKIRSGRAVEAPTSEPGAVMKCPFEFKQLWRSVGAGSAPFSRISPRAWMTWRS